MTAMKIPTKIPPQTSKIRERPDCRPDARPRDSPFDHAPIPGFYDFAPNRTPSRARLSDDDYSNTLTLPMRTKRKCQRRSLSEPSDIALRPSPEKTDNYSSVVEEVAAPAKARAASVTTFVLPVLLELHKANIT